MSSTFGLIGPRIEPMDFKAKLNRACALRRLTNQRELADLARVSKSSLNRWLLGASYPDVREAARLAKVLEVPLDWLASDDDQEELPAAASLSEDEQAVIDLFHALELDKREALRRLATPGPELRKEGEPTREPRTFIGEATSHYTYDTTDARLAREREKNRPKKSTEGHGKSKSSSVDKGSATTK